MMLEPAVESRPWAEGLAIDGARAIASRSPTSSKRSAFYREKLSGAGVSSARGVGGFADIAALPLCPEARAQGDVYAGQPVRRPLLPRRPRSCGSIDERHDRGRRPTSVDRRRSRECWVPGSARSYAASGVAAGDRFVDPQRRPLRRRRRAHRAFDRAGLCHIAVGTGNADRLMLARSRLLRPGAAAFTPSYAAYAIEWAGRPGFSLRGSSVRRVLVAGEPGWRAGLPRAARGGWGAKVTGRWASATSAHRSGKFLRSRDGMPLGARDFVHAELIDPETGSAVELEDGATGEARADPSAAPRSAALRFRTRATACVFAWEPCRCGAVRACAASGGPTTC